MGYILFQTGTALFAQKNARILPENSSRANIWVFIMAGQSNMAGRAVIKPEDTISNSRILTVDNKGSLLIAKEPLHFYEPEMAGLDCGISFGKELLKHISDSITVLILPAAVGGSNIRQWMGDSVHRNVKLLSNLKEKLEIGAKYGTLKAILWHQGESDAKACNVSDYKLHLQKAFTLFRSIARNDSLTILTGPIGEFNNDNKYKKCINNAIEAVDLEDSNVYSIRADDFDDIGDQLHFDSESQRKMGVRMAQEFLKKLK